MLDITNIIGTFAVGGIGWLTTHFAAGPILALYKLRQRIHEEIEYTKNVGWIHANGTIDPKEKDRFDEAVRELRRLMAQLSALNVASPNMLRWYLKLRCLLSGRQSFDLDKAVKGLTGLSNSLADPADHTDFISQIEDALSLPCSYSTEMRKNLRASQNRRIEG